MSDLKSFTEKKILNGKRIADFQHTPTVDQTLDRFQQSLLSNYGLRILGWNETDGPIEVSVEALESHIHVLGSPGEGKSKFLELLIRQNIDAGQGACLIDPSDNGDTMRKVLKYAIDIGYEKIVIIDPHDIVNHGYCTSLNPLRVKKDEQGKPILNAAQSIVGNLFNMFQILWNRKGAEETPRIAKYLPGIFRALYAADLTLSEARYFSDKLFKHQAFEILRHLPMDDLKRLHIEAAFLNSREWDGFTPTVNVLEPLDDPALQIMFGSKVSPLKFTDLVAQNYLILVNLDSEGIWGEEVTAQQRLLGTVVISEIVNAIGRLRRARNAWHGVYYLYIDEIGDYATTKLTYLLDKKRKSGLRLTLAHQGFDQMPNNVESAIRRGCKIKAAFYTADSDDRLKMIRMMFGGELSDREVSFHLSMLPKQNAYIKINKAPTRQTTIQEVPDSLMTDDELDYWKERHYAAFPWYKKPKAVRQEIDDRISPYLRNGAASKLNTERNFGGKTRRNNKVSGSRANHDRGPADNAPPGDIEAILSEKEKGWDTR